MRGVPGLFALIVFSCFNNFLGGTFMALMDAYGLSLVSVQAWGLLWGVLSAGVIIGGLMVTRTGVGTQPGSHPCCSSTWSLWIDLRGLPRALLDRAAGRLP